MSLAFAHPGFLWGALFAGLPILLHLLRHRRAKQHPFAAIAFVLRSEARHARTLRLKRLLLLLMRVAACVAIPLALARPYLATPHSNGPVAREAKAQVLVLDRSFSMRFKHGTEPSLFERSREQALAQLKTLGPADTVAVLACPRAPNAQGPALSFDPSEARLRVKALQPSYLPAALDGCVADAAALLQGAAQQSAEVMVFTDLCASAWSAEAQAPPLKRKQGDPIQVRILDVAKGRAMPNHWIDSLAIEPAFALGPRGYTFDLGVRASAGMERKRLGASLWVGDKETVRGFVGLSKNGTIHKALSHRFEAGGGQRGTVQLQPDGLPEDDRRAYRLTLRRNLHVLIVDGEPTTSRFEDEVYFVKRALAPGHGAQSAIFPKIVDAEGFENAGLKALDLVLLLNVPAPSLAAANKLRAFVEAGGGLFVSVGDAVDPEATNQSLGALLPAPLHLPKDHGLHGVGFGAIAWNHPLFASMALSSTGGGEGREGFNSARFFRTFLTRPLSAGARVVATYEDEMPALILKELGRGRVALYTSSVDRAWTDFPIRTAFLPTLQQLAGYLSHGLDEGEQRQLMVGEPKRLRVPAGTLALAVVDPAGHQKVLTLPSEARPSPSSEGHRDGTQAGSRSERSADTETSNHGEREAGTLASVLYRDTHEPGLYRVLRRAKGEPALRPDLSLDFVVQLDPKGSDTTRLSALELQSRFGEAAADAEPVVQSGPGGDEPLWSLALALMVLLLAAEGFLLR